MWSGWSGSLQNQMKLCYVLSCRSTIYQAPCAEECSVSLNHRHDEIDEAEFYARFTFPVNIKALPIQQHRLHRLDFLLGARDNDMYCQEKRHIGLH